MTSSAPVGVGIIGAGYISDIYLQNCMSRFDNLRIVGIADLVMGRARSQADAYGVEAFAVGELIAHPEVEIVVNLTIPAAHGDVALAVVEAGTSVYNEKPITTTREQGLLLLRRAEKHGVLIGAAPDTFLGGGLQTVRALLDGGVIGTPVAATGTKLTSGDERWHPNPGFYYQPGGGPLFDMGPYYLTALLSLLGPVGGVSGIATASFPTRTIGSGPRKGEVVPVDTPTHIVTALEFTGGATASLTTSFDVWDTTHSALILYGSEGTLRLPDPNTFGGPIELLRAGADAWEPIDLPSGNTENRRGLGVSDLARALESREQGRHVAINSVFDRPEPLVREQQKIESQHVNAREITPSQRSTVDYLR